VGNLRRAPALTAIPTYKWVLTVFQQDILQRVTEVKASITCLRTNPEDGFHEKGTFSFFELLIRASLRLI
jgi:hypothetical protein